MPPLFPNVERIELFPSPLELVVCQVRFPPVLTLVAGKPPDEFQQRIQDHYPVARQQRITSFEASPTVGAQVSTSAHWAFDDVASEWTASLGHDFFALEAKRYRGVQDFITRFLEVFAIAQDLYPIQVRERIGLRYVDKISREAFPALPSDWPRQIRQGIIPLRGVRHEAEPQLGRFEVVFPFDRSMLAIRSNYVDSGFPGAQYDELLLDFDCYTEQRGSFEGIDAILQQFRELSYKAFRWAIGDLIHCFPPVVTEDPR